MSSSYTNTKRLIESLVDEPITVKEREHRKMVEDSSAEQLVENTSLTSTSADEYQVEFRGDESGEWYAEASHFAFHTEPIALITWLEVNPDIRGNDVGRTLREEHVRQVDADVLYTNILDTRLQSVAIDQGFRPIQDGALEGFYIRD